MTNAQVQRYDDADQLVAATAEDLLATLDTRIREAGEAHLCLTGGTVAARLYRRIGESGAALDWAKVHFWWGDERWVPAGDADRNDHAARQALGDEIWSRAQVHAMPAADPTTGLDEAAALYAAELDRTRFDLCLLGVGPDGHVASLFPDHPSSTTPVTPGTSGQVIGVRNSPKPPPERISLTLPVINAARQVWLVVSGSDKADAVAQALTAGSTLPAAEVEGVERTLWRLDAAAAGGVASEPS